MKTPTRSPTHADIELSRLSSMGLELDELAEECGGGGDTLQLTAIVELAEDRGRPASHYLAALAAATELRVAPPDDARVTVRACVGNCQRWGALDLVSHFVDRIAARHPRVALAPVACLDRCDAAPACELHSADGKLVLAPATASALDEAIASLVG